MQSRDLFQLRWASHLQRDSDGAPLLSPLFVVAQGPGVHLVDLRSPEEATGALGYIPGSVCLPDAQLDQLPRDLPVVLASRTGSDAAHSAKRLEKQGMTHVAGLAGGVVAWRKLGLGVSRDPAGLASTLDRAAESAPTGAFLTADRIREHIGDPRSVRWVKMFWLVSQGFLSCIDGRDERGVIGTLGGNAGELLLFLAAVESTGGQTLDETTVSRILLKRLDTFGDFYMHTDDHALDALRASLRADPLFRGSTAHLDTPARSIDFLQHPPAPLREPLLEHLLDPAHIGCGHVRLMLENSEQYGVRRELVANLLRAIYTLWWEGVPEIQITALPGGHEEAAVLNVRIEDEISGLSSVPLISPACGGRQMFVNHPDVACHLRRAAVHVLNTGHRQELQTTIDNLADRQLTATLGHLAKGLPIVEAVFMRDGTIDVRASS